MKTLIHGGTIYDGSGGNPQKADLLIQDGRIAAIGQGISCDDAEPIDVRDRVVTPGFVDIHRHCDAAPFIYADFGRIELSQGITTTVVGNCGLAPVPSSARWRDAAYDFIEPVIGSIPHNMKFENYSDYISALQNIQLPLNMGFLAAAGAIKTAVKGFSKTPYSPQELHKAAEYVHDAMDQGAFGLSLGIMYQPECFSSFDDNVVLAHAAAEKGGILCTHIRGEGDSLLESVQEVINIADRAGISLNISHFKATGIKNWHNKIFKAIELIETARARGQEVTVDFYPYDGGSTTLLSLLPPGMPEDNSAASIAKLANTQGKQKLREELRKHHPGWDNMADSIGWERIVISSVTLPRHAAYQGMSIAKLALQNGYNEPEDFVADLLAEEKGKVGIIVLSMSQQDVDLIARLPYAALISDSLYGGGGNPHPRLYGAFPKLLREMVREKKLLTMQEAIHKMTAMPASRVGLRRRGRLEQGMCADILVFDMDKFMDKSDYNDPQRFADGMELVMLNGAAVWKNGTPLPHRNGCLVLHA